MNGEPQSPEPSKAPQDRKTVQQLEDELTDALADVEHYKGKLDAANSVIEEAEELVEYTWQQLESAKEQAKHNSAAESRALELEKQAEKMQLELKKSTSNIRQMQEVADLAEERAYEAEQALYLREQEQELESSPGIRDFRQALDLAVRKAKRYERGLAVYVFSVVPSEVNLEKLVNKLRDSDFFARLDDTTFGVVIEEDLPYHDIGEAIERLTERVRRPFGASIFGVDASTPKELLKIARQALENQD